MDIPMRILPRTWRVPYIRTKYSWMAPADGETCMTTSLAQYRDFERTHATGLYGYPVFMEVL